VSPGDDLGGEPPGGAIVVEDILTSVTREVEEPQFVVARPLERQAVHPLVVLATSETLTLIHVRPASNSAVPVACERREPFVESWHENPESRTHRT
jgi:hypothetical protein